MCSKLESSSDISQMTFQNKFTIVDVFCVDRQRDGTDKENRHFWTLVKSANTPT
jgi:hypothetical protein